MKWTQNRKAQLIRTPQVHDKKKGRDISKHKWYYQYVKSQPPASKPSKKQLATIIMFKGNYPQTCKALLRNLFKFGLVM